MLVSRPFDSSLRYSPNQRSHNGETGLLLLADLHVMRGGSNGLAWPLHCVYNGENGGSDVLADMTRRGLGLVAWLHLQRSEFNPTVLIFVLVIFIVSGDIFR